ncbi:major facilitator superfamily domain-containing protein [Papiliotrema laurentii]|uniref:Major facilitator superfamily domain-containing protein n=1 Tax=Papiliotrema laurentii TaxID=5418 RepID=A0AAD9CZY8_PAPLA|nr:major facilitator superfamily domain-containing protein [Papiliotrema laurentii]
MSLLRRNIDDDQAARDIEVLDAPSSARASVSAPTPMEVEKALEGGMSNAQGGSEGEGFETPRKKAKGSGLTEGDQDMDALPQNNLWLVMPAIGLVLFLAALDISIVSTALPTIAEDLNATPSEYSWVGTSYLLGSTIMTPLNGRVSDIIGRKPMIYGAILFFTVFSALCGAAKNMTWLIAARAFQGMGGGSIIGLTNILISDIIPLHRRGSFQGVLGGVWGCASAAGPLFGGLLTEKATWRWVFYINLPTCGISFVALLLTLRLNPTRKQTFSQLSKTFDFLGMALTIIGTALLVVGFAQAADFGFGNASAYGVIIAGALLFALAIVNCLYTKRVAIIPARMFKIRTTFFFLIGSLLHALAFIPSNYLLPQMFQGVRGDSPLRSGVHLLPFSMTVAFGTVVAGLINSRLRILRPVVWFGYGLAALGYGLFYGLFRYPFSVGLQEGIQIVAGAGVGLSLSAPMLILQAAMPLKEMAATTSAYTLTRNLGGSLGLAIFTAILNTELRSRFVKLEGYGTVFEVPESAAGYLALQELPDGPMKTAVLSAFADSLGTCWIIACAMFIACLLLTLWTKSYSLNRTPGKGPVQPSSSLGNQDPEALVPGPEGNETDAMEEGDVVGERTYGGKKTNDLEQSRSRGFQTPTSEKTAVDSSSRESSRDRTGGLISKA